MLEAQLRLLETRAHAELQNDRVRWEMTREEIKATREELEHTRRLHRELTILSPTSGMFVLSVAAQDLPDRYLRKGQEIGYVVPAAAVTARVLVSQDDVDLVRTRTREVRVKLAGSDVRDLLRRRAPGDPGGEQQRPQPRDVLRRRRIGAARSADTKNPKTLSSWFEFELELPATHAFVLGEHVYVRFEHGCGAARLAHLPVACGSCSCSGSRSDGIVLGPRRRRLSRARRAARRQARSAADRGRATSPAASAWARSGSELIVAATNQRRERASRR